ncbi:hypothetical protein RJT34_11240 [Clitoria ternatea]|uniref:non-specific serine/threonine protein kinase n=1 Tax=Clitoria ternatea TaxID=43366 RepID=A0AAN9PJC3_CLITE
MEVNEKCDVFSFGVMSLEMLMGKHPGDLISSLFSSFAMQSSSDLLLKDVLDKRIPCPVELVIIQELILVARVTFACLSESPHSRPTMEQVHNEFMMPKSPLVDPFPMITLGQLLHN